MCVRPLKVSCQRETEMNVENGYFRSAAPLIQIQMPNNLYCLSLYVLFSPLLVLQTSIDHLNFCVLSCQLFFFSQMRSTQRFITPASSSLPTLHLCAWWFWHIFRYATSSGASRCVHKSYLFLYEETHRGTLLASANSSDFPRFGMWIWLSML